MRGRIRGKILLACWALLTGAGGALGQTTAEVNAGVQFNFSNPGARSLGLGGAFIGLADDATAAYANPAGLTILSEPEVSVEVRQWDFTTTFVESGRLPRTGAPRNIGVDTVAGLRNGEASDTVTGLSFLSAVYPGGRWAVAIYRHELANYKTAFETSGAFTQSGFRTRPKINSFNLEIVNVGLAGAVRLGDRLSIGAGLSSYDLSLHSRTDRYGACEGRNPPPGTEPGQCFGPPLYTPENLVDTQIQTGDDRKIGFNAGFQWAVTDGWTLGGVYRQGPELELDAIYVPGALPLDEAPISQTRSTRYDTPDVYGLGVAVQPNELMTATFDVVHIEYSDLTNEFINILLFQNDTNFIERDLPNFRANDVTEVHLGFERIFPLSRSLLAARLGAWYDPEHRIRYFGATPGFQAAFRPGSDEMHYAAGFGFISTRWNFQADAAFDYSDPVKTASLSAVIRF